jgi:hypothetical protein
LGVIASSFVFIAVPVSASAGECSAADPCMTYAMVDGSGNVTNVIVCQPSVCGPGGQLGGTIDGNRLVPQVAANPQTHDTTGTTGHMTSSEQNQVVTLSNDNVFTVKKDEVVVEKIAVPETEPIVGGTITTSMEYKSETMTVFVQDGLNPDGTEKFIGTDVQIDTFKATQTTTQYNNSSTLNEELKVDATKTKEEVISFVQNSDYVIFKRKLEMLSRLLDERYSM